MPVINAIVAGLSARLAEAQATTQTPRVNRGVCCGLVQFSAFSPSLCWTVWVGGLQAYCASIWAMVGSLKARVRASLNTSLISLVLVAWLGTMPKRWFSDAP